MALTNPHGRDWWTLQFANYTGFTGTASGLNGSTGFTHNGTPSGWTTNGWRDHVVVMGATFGIITANTTGASATVTIDQWYAPATTGGSAASNPTAGTYVILPGAAPAIYLAIGTGTTSVAGTETAVETETTHSSLARKVFQTLTHNSGDDNYIVSATWNSTDGTPRTISRVGIVTNKVVADSRLVFYAAVSNPPVVASGDQLTITETVTAS